MCPEHVCKFDVNTCEIINEPLNEKFNFKDAKFTDKGQIMVR